MLTTRPDQGYAWCVLVVAFLYNVIEGSVYMSPAVYMIDWLGKFNTSTANIGFVASMMNGVNYFTGFLFIGPLVDRFGCRVVGVAGNVILSFGFIATAFATSVAWLYVTYGLIVGVGLGLMSNPSIIIIQFYFDKKRPFATGMSLCGHSIGNFLMLPLLRYFIEEYGVTGALVLHGGIMVQNILFSAFFRPNKLQHRLNSHYRTGVQDVKVLNELTDGESKEILGSEDVNENDRWNTGTDTAIPTQMTRKSSVTSIKSCSGLADNEMRTGKLRQIVTYFRKTWDFHLFRNKAFVLFLLGEMLHEFGTGLTYRFTSVKAVEADHMTPLHAAFLPSVAGLCSTVSRVVTSFVVNTGCVNRIALCGMAAVCQGFITALSCVANTFTMYMIFMGCFGITSGMFYTVCNTVLVDLIGVQKMAQAKSFSSLSIGCAVLTTLPLAGGIIDRTTNYDIPYYLYGGLGCLAGVSILGAYCTEPRIDASKEQHCVTCLRRIAKDEGFCEQKQDIPL